jgi:hypothetical protein
MTDHLWPRVCADCQCVKVCRFLQELDGRAIGIACQCAVDMRIRDNAPDYRIFVERIWRRLALAAVARCPYFIIRDGGAMTGMPCPYPPPPGQNCEQCEYKHVCWPQSQIVSNGRRYAQELLAHLDHPWTLEEFDALAGSIIAIVLAHCPHYRPSVPDTDERSGM